jgi:hypothetical protein
MNHSNLADACSRAAVANTAHMHATKTAKLPQIKPPIPWTGSEPALRLSRDGAFFGKDAIHPADLVHVLAAGGTGSGKTVSVVQPALQGFINYALPDGRRSSVFVIDPKHELEAKVREVLRQQHQLQRLVVIGQCPPVRFFDAGSALLPQDKLDLLDGVLDQKRLSEGSHAYWHEAGMQVVCGFMALEDAMQRLQGRSLIEALAQRCGAGAGRAGFWASLQHVFTHSRTGRGNFRQVAAMLREELTKVELQAHPAAHVMAQFAGTEDDLQQWCFRMQTASLLVDALASADLAAYIDFDPWPAAADQRTDIGDLMERGAVVLFQPSHCNSGTLAARALKARVYAEVFCRRDMERPVAVVVDEAQRFVTLDEYTGEASFLDRCRAYRTNVVLATQSLTSLEHAMGSGSSAQAAARLLWANTPSKWFLRSTEQTARACVRELIPPSPLGDGTPHVVDVRPLAQLEPGEAYWVLADGTWGRGRARREGLL